MLLYFVSRSSNKPIYSQQHRLRQYLRSFLISFYLDFYKQLTKSRTQKFDHVNTGCHIANKKFLYTIGGALIMSIFFFYLSKNARQKMILSEFLYILYSATSQGMKNSDMLIINLEQMRAKRTKNYYNTVAFSSTTLRLSVFKVRLLYLMYT